jgi:hypothetical protein
MAAEGDVNISRTGSHWSLVIDVAIVTLGDRIESIIEGEPADR